MPPFIFYEVIYAFFEFIGMDIPPPLAPEVIWIFPPF
jgi:hypothetical protein